MATSSVQLSAINLESQANLVQESGSEIKLTLEHLIEGTVVGRETSVTDVASILVVFDSRVQDLEILYNALVPGAVGYTIDAQEDALAVMTQLLTQTGARRLAIVAHGEPGVVQIGAQPLNWEELQKRSGLLQEWGVEEIALYSCEVGADTQFVVELARLKGAEVFAASGKVGAAVEGGSWTIGQNPTTGYFNNLALAAYSDVLAVINGTTGNDSLNGTNDNDLLNGGAGNDTQRHSN